jgi:hypothetical protein
MALQLLVAVTHAAGLTECAHCGNWFLLERRQPVAGKRFGKHLVQNNYCSDCRNPDRAKTPPAQLAAASRWREKHPDYFKKRYRNLKRSKGTKPRTPRSKGSHAKN